MRTGFKSKVSRGKRFLKEDIWNIRTDGLTGFKGTIIHSLKIVLFTARTFSARKIGFQSVALSFFCTMAVVPFVAVALAITKGLGLADKLETLLYTNFPSNPDAVQYMMTYADNIIHKASSSVLGFISAAFFVWLIIWMMLCVESVFNSVWNVHHSRSFVTRIWRNIAIVIISPFLMLLLYGGAIFLSGYIEQNVLKWGLILIVSTLVFSAMYTFIPNTKVRWKYAFTAACYSGLAFTIIQFVYVESQIFLTRLSGIYGAIAAIPFFMFWLNFSWWVILAGAELCYAFQNINQTLDDKDADKALQ